MSKPLIGITTRNAKDGDQHPTVSIQHAYVNAISQAGGLPIPIPSLFSEGQLDDLFQKLDGIVFSGGGDIALDYFEGQPHSRIGGVDDSRDRTEIHLVRRASEDGKPMLGICRGAQVMNVALGGNLYTDIADQIPNSLDHHGKSRTALLHSVNVDESSSAAEIFEETLLHVNSLHHQSIKDLAPGLHAVGFASDGVVETVELVDHPFGVAVQWHPEWLLDQPAMLRLFGKFVIACSA